MTSAYLADLPAEIRLLRLMREFPKQSWNFNMCIGATDLSAFSTYRLLKKLYNFSSITTESGKWNIYKVLSDKERFLIAPKGMIEIDMQS